METPPSFDTPCQHSMCTSRSFCEQVPLESLPFSFDLVKVKNSKVHTKF